MINDEKNVQPQNLYPDYYGFFDYGLIRAEKLRQHVERCG